MKIYTITIKVKEKNLDDVIGMIASNSDYDGSSQEYTLATNWISRHGLIESLDWEESK